MCCCESDDDEDGNGGSGNGGGLSSSSLSAQATFNINSSGDERAYVYGRLERNKARNYVFVQGLSKALVRGLVKFIPVH